MMGIIIIISRICIGIILIITAITIIATKPEHQYHPPGQLRTLIIVVIKLRPGRHLAYQWIGQLVNLVFHKFYLRDNCNLILEVGEIQQISIVVAYVDEYQLDTDRCSAFHMNHKPACAFAHTHALAYNFLVFIDEEMKEVATESRNPSTSDTEYTTSDNNYQEVIVHAMISCSSCDSRRDKYYGECEQSPPPPKPCPKSSNSHFCSIIRETEISGTRPEILGDVGVLSIRSTPVRNWYITYRLRFFGVSRYGRFQPFVRLYIRDKLIEMQIQTDTRKYIYVHTRMNINLRTPVRFARDCADKYIEEDCVVKNITAARKTTYCIRTCDTDGCNAQGLEMRGGSSKLNIFTYLVFGLALLLNIQQLAFV
uniref:Uncharacterized protein n=1 Tax=Octopus bimaculoides TaxID=37653 RepID=A0A0L8ICT5_OCTBM